MIEKIREYFIKNVTLAEEFTNILADFLEKDATAYSIEPIPTEFVLKQYADGGSLRQFVFQFGSREFYDNSVMQNIENLNFYEKFQKEIEENNNKKTLPEIEGIQTIECLNYGSIQDVESGLAKYIIQMRITYIKEV